MKNDNVFAKSTCTYICTIITKPVLNVRVGYHMNGNDLKGDTIYYHRMIKETVLHL